MQKSSIHSVVYQIWPRSFMDSNDDGIGDIKGILSRLDHVKQLGANQIWLSPVYQSPNHDYGYDVQDYYSIQPEFGTMADMDELIRACHERGIELIMDLVANHTSDQHPWFQAALRDVNSKYRDYYFFREGKQNKEPNNWISLFGGSAWTKVAGEENRYYLSLFTPNQCDLNWRNPELRTEIHKIMHFWLDKGIDGFRMDVINMISKVPDLVDKNPHKKGYQFADDLIISRPESFDYLMEMYDKVMLDKRGLFIGEGVLINPMSAKRYSGKDTKMLDLMFHFDTVLIGCGPLGKYDFRKFYRWTIKEFKAIYFKWQLASLNDAFYLGNFLSNHDNGRAVSRFGDEKKYHRESAKALNLLTLMSRGTPFIYQGEEIGMTNLKLEQEDWRDFEAINDYVVLQEMMHLPKFFAKKIVQKMTRDNARTPMQWTNEVYAGFSKSKPWIKVNPNKNDINVLDQVSDEDSILAFTKQAIELYKSDETFAFGDVRPYLIKHPELLAFERVGLQHYLVLINLSKHNIHFPVAENVLDCECLISNYSLTPLMAKMVFRPFEARVYRVK